jgi:hypothetical protein
MDFVIVLVGAQAVCWEVAGGVCLQHLPVYCLHFPVFSSSERFFRASGFG